jgi:hypothetical protein
LPTQTVQFRSERLTTAGSSCLSSSSFSSFSHYAMLQRNLLYTGVTRGKKLVVLVGQKASTHQRPSLQSGA